LESVRAELERERSASQQAAREAGDLRRRLDELAGQASAPGAGSARELQAAVGRAAELEAEIARRAQEEGALRSRIVALEAQVAQGERSAQASRVAPAVPLSPPRPVTDGGPSASAEGERELVAVIEPLAPAAEPVADLEAPIDAVRSWAQAWSAQDVRGYLEAYDSSFAPPDGLSRSEWEAQRRQRLIRPAFVQVSVSDIEARPLEPDRVVVTFVQSYRSDTFSDRVLKTLELARRDGAWKIVREQSE
jgi:hypothetical protein